MGPASEHAGLYQCVMRRRVGKLSLWAERRKTGKIARVNERPPEIMILQQSARTNGVPLNLLRTRVTVPLVIVLASMVRCVYLRLISTIVVSLVLLVINATVASLLAFVSCVS